MLWYSSAEHLLPYPLPNLSSPSSRYRSTWIRTSSIARVDPCRAELSDKEGGTGSGSSLLHCPHSFLGLKCRPPHTPAVQFHHLSKFPPPSLGIPSTTTREFTANVSWQSSGWQGGPALIHAGLPASASILMPYSTFATTVTWEHMGN